MEEEKMLSIYLLKMSESHSFTSHTGVSFLKCEIDVFISRKRYQIDVNLCVQRLSCLDKGLL